MNRCQCFLLLLDDRVWRQSTVSTGSARVMAGRKWRLSSEFSLVAAGADLFGWRAENLAGCDWLKRERPGRDLGSRRNRINVPERRGAERAVRTIAGFKLRP